jgi:hypothetical protein
VSSGGGESVVTVFRGCLSCYRSLIWKGFCGWGFPGGCHAGLDTSCVLLLYEMLVVRDAATAEEACGVHVFRSCAAANLALTVLYRWQCIQMLRRNLFISDGVSCTPRARALYRGRAIGRGLHIGG